MPPITFNPLGGSWSLVALLLAAIAVVVLVVRPNARSVSPSRRRAETILRLLTLAVFAVLFTRPAAVVVEEEELPATVVLLCDLSESMTIEDGDASGNSRYDAMRAAFEGARDTLRALCSRFNVRVFGIGETPEELEIDEGVVKFPESPTAQESRLGNALEDALRTTAGRRLLSVAVLSDGTQRTWESDAATPQDAALRYRDAERPITVVPFGAKNASAAVRDLSVEDLRANDRVYVGNEFVVSGRLRALGFAGREVPVTFEFETQPGETTPVGTQTFVPESDDATIPWQFTYKPTEPGEWKLRVSTPSQPKELLETNNELSAFVEVIDGGVRALYIEGTRRFEQNFLRAALESSSDVMVRYWRPPVSSLVAKFPERTEAELVSTLAGSRNSLVEPFFSPGKFSTYILGDVDSTAFQKDELEALAGLVEQGAGLIILAGERALGSGGYGQTPLAELAPVETSTALRLPLDSDLSTFEGADSPRLDGEFQATLTDAAEDSRDAFAIGLSVDQRKNRELWNALPPITGVYRLGRVKRNATTLLTARSTGAKKGADYPLLTVQQYGLGRVAILATDSTWRWRMRGKEAEHTRFWRQLVLWSAKTDELLEGELAIEMDSARLAPGQEASFSVVYRPKEGEKLDETRAEATIIGPDGTRESVSLTREDGVWRGVGTHTGAVGDYQLEASLLSSSDDVLQRTRARFLVFKKNLELERPGASPEVMNALAATSQGNVVLPEDFGSYLEELLKERETAVDTREVKRTLYDTWSVFWAFVALMTSDWLLRRRYGMA